MKKTTSILSGVLIFLIVLGSFFSLPTSAKGSVITDGISLLQIDQNVKGNGYSWDNINSILTLDGIDLNTDDEYGLKIPDGATVILKGTNSIKATKAAVYLQGTVIFRGSGSLTLVGDDYGFLFNSTNTTEKVTFSAGTYKISGGKGAIKSDYQKVYLSGGKFTLDGGDGYAIDARELQTGGNVKIMATGSFYSSYQMTLEAADISITSEEAALIAPRSLTIAAMTLRAGDSKDSLSTVTEYTGQSVLVTKSTFDEGAKSILFGPSVSIVVDILLLVGIVLLLTAAIVVPLLVRRKRAALAIAARDAAAEEAEKRRKAEKKAAKKR